MLEFLKDLYGEESLTREQLEAKLQEQGKDRFNIVNLAEGNYVSKSKFEGELADKEKQIETLRDSINTRDKDLKDLKKQLEKAGTDENKLSELQAKFDTLKADYDTATKQYEKAIEEAKTESAVKELAGNYEFTSPAAKRDFISSILKNQIQLDGDKIIGANDLVAAYKAENEQSFVVEKKTEETKPQQTAPQFVNRDTTPPPERKLTLTERMALANQKQ